MISTVEIFWPFCATAAPLSITLSECHVAEKRDGNNSLALNSGLAPKAMEAPGQEYLFLGERLGMVYGVQGGKVTIIGLDSNVYQQSSHVVLPTNSTKLGVAEEEVDNEERKKYKDAISILPAAPEPEPEPGSAPGPDISNDTVVGTSVKLEKSESTKMTAAEMLSAIANFEDGPDEDQPPLDPAATDVQHAPDQNHQGASVDPATSPHPEGAAGASHGFADVSIPPLCLLVAIYTDLLCVCAERGDVGLV